MRMKLGHPKYLEYLPCVIRLVLLATPCKTLRADRLTCSSNHLGQSHLADSGTERMLLASSQHQTVALIMGAEKSEVDEDSQDERAKAFLLRQGPIPGGASIPASAPGDAGPRPKGQGNGKQKAKTKFKAEDKGKAQAPGPMAPVEVEAPKEPLVDEPLAEAATGTSTVGPAQVVAQTTGAPVQTGDDDATTTTGALNDTVPVTTAGTSVPTEKGIVHEGVPLQPMQDLGGLGPELDAAEQEQGDSAKQEQGDSGDRHTSQSSNGAVESDGTAATPAPEAENATLSNTSNATAPSKDAGSSTTSVTVFHWLSLLAASSELLNLAL